MNTPITFETAKLLKEKGFDIQIDYGLNQILNLKSAPTIAEVVMWLYEKHGIWIEVQCPDMPTKLWSFNIHKFQKYGGYGMVEILTHNSPTEAYEAGIEYTLNKLI